ncbi:hypothetical protein NQ315_003548 [Exocentrus adspersus]|uniref:DUF5641 domain-containing protein n=1 Tax=Exocentrus adspersus TaxID=1586481 RepID=A0AAV8VDV1_9CUCU|nr:hypothetical protein NQ315_003548 [Exocentrus adspersus]
MYRMILVDPKQRCYQRIIWRETPEEPLNEYELNTVTYGTASASYLSVRCIKQIAIDCQADYPEASQAISKDFYVDDFLSGGNSIEEVNRGCLDVSSILQSAGFKLRKWTSNEPAALTNLDSNCISEHLLLSNPDSAKTLGIFWTPQSDILKYRIPDIPHHPPTTKRTVLSNISQIFDPLGLIAPCIIIAKILLQRLWSLKIEWDHELPEDINTQWNKFRNELPKLHTIQIPRCVISRQSIQELTKPHFWHYVQTDQNPADLLTRGLCPSKINNAFMWWSGPPWLQNEEARWPIADLIRPEVLPESRTSTVSMLGQQAPVLVEWQRFSSLSRIKRAMAYCLRFIHHCRARENRIYGVLTSEELIIALHTLIRLSQTESFGDVIRCLKHNQPLPTKCNLLSLNPFLDSEGILRVGGRLQNSNFPYSKRHPIILPPQHLLTKLICQHEHLALMHAGPQLMLSSMKERYWPVSGKNLVKQVEAVLNSRPLTPLSNDPSDFNALTPSHFLIGRTATSLPDPDLKDIATNRLSRFQHLQQIVQHFWQIWQREYIFQLQNRSKWRTTSPNLKCGTLVLIMDEASPPMMWALGRITKLHPGRDGIARVATVKTATSEYRRAISKLCPLPIPAEDSSIDRTPVSPPSR